MGGHELTLWPACVRTHALAEQIAATAMAGYSSLAINPATYHAAISSGLSPRDIRRIADGHHVRFKWVDAVSGWLPIRYPAEAPELKGFLDYDLDLAFEIAEELGAEAILAIGCFQEGELPLAQQAGCFDALCRRAESRKLRVGLEFIPTWGIRDLKSAWRIASAVDAPNGGYVIDTWHFFRSSSDPGASEAEYPITKSSRCRSPMLPWIIPGELCSMTASTFAGCRAKGNCRCCRCSI